MNVAFIQHAQHEIHRNQRGGNQHRLVGQRRLEGRGRALIGGLYTRRHPHIGLHFVHRRHGVAQGYARSQIERQRNHGKLALVVHRDGNGGRLHAREGIERDLAAIRKNQRGVNRRSAGSRRAGPYKQLAEVRGILVEPGLHFQHHVILVQLRKDGRDLPLSISVVQRLVDGRCGDSQPRGRVAVEHQCRPQSEDLLIAGHVAQLRQLLQLGEHLRREAIQLVYVRIFQRVLELGAAHAVFDREILHRLHEQRDARHLRQLRLQAANHIAGAYVSSGQRFQVDQNAPAIQGCISAVDSNERRQIIHRRVLQNHLGQLLLLPGHFRKGHRLGRFGDTLDDARILNGKEPFGNYEEQEDGHTESRGRHQQRGELPAQHPL